MSLTEALQTAEDRKKKAALFSLLAALFLTTVKLGVGLYTNSLALLSEALHSGLDLVASLLTFYAIRVSSRPADKRHPYGHGKMENISALAETLLLFIICLYVGYEGVHRLVEGGSPVIPSLWGVGVMLLSLAVDISRVRNLRKVARETNSQALEADALHFSTDILSSAVVFVGVLAVWLADRLALPPDIARIVHQADTLAALAVALIIFKVSLAMAKQALDYLMDAAPEDVVDRMEESVASLDEVHAVTRLRIRSSGSQYFVDLNVAVDPRLSVSNGHRVASKASAKVREILPEADVVVHVDPWHEKRHAGLLADIHYVAETLELDVHDLRVLKNPDGTYAATAHVEFAENEPFGKAYEKCKVLEARVHEEHPEVKLVTHVEPDRSEQISHELLPGENSLADYVKSRVDACVAREPLVSDAHGFACYRTSLGLSVVFHCHACATLSVREMHDISDRLEKALQAEIEGLDHVLVHMEPTEDLRKAVFLDREAPVLS